MADTAVMEATEEMVDMVVTAVIMEEMATAAMEATVGAVSSFSWSTSLSLTI